MTWAMTITRPQAPIPTVTLRLPEVNGGMCVTGWSS